MPVFQRNRHNYACLNFGINMPVFYESGPSMAPGKMFRRNRGSENWNTGNSQIRMHSVLYMNGKLRIWEIVWVGCWYMLLLSLSSYGCWSFHFYTGKRCHTLVYVLLVLSRLHKEGRLWHFEQMGECENVRLRAVWLSVQPAKLQ